MKSSSGEASEGGVMKIKMGLGKRSTGGSTISMKLKPQVRLIVTFNISLDVLLLLM